MVTGDHLRVRGDHGDDVFNIGAVFVNVNGDLNLGGGDNKLTIIAATFERVSVIGGLNDDVSVSRDFFWEIRQQAGDDNARVRVTSVLVTSSSTEALKRWRTSSPSHREERTSEPMSKNTKWPRRLVRRS